MYATVDIEKQETKTTILIRPQKSTVFKIALATLTIILLPALLLALGLIIAGQIENSFEVFALLGGVTVLLIFIYKHLRGAFRKEVITIENNKLTYTNSFLGLGKYFETNLDKLKMFKYVGYAEQTKHPLDIKGDVLGFGTQQGEVNYLNQIGTIILATEFEVLKFGVDVDEEDFFKIKQLLD